MSDQTQAQAEQRPDPTDGREYRRRRNEKLFDARVTQVRAVVATPEQRCWVEREEVVQERRRPNVPGAVIGGVLSGILGYQISGGSGRDIATAGGAVAGAAVGANVNRGSNRITTQDVQRCSTTPTSNKADYWDVTYNFQGQEHQVQLAAPPDATIKVNRLSEPRA